MSLLWVEILILCFHEIGEVKDCNLFAAQFAKSMTTSLSDFIRIIDRYPNAEIHFDDGRRGVLVATQLLKQRKRSATLFLVPQFILGNIPRQEQYSDFLSVDEIKYLLRLGFKIGSHSYSHAALTKLPFDSILSELNSSKKFLENTFNVTVTHFSYPFGLVNDRVKHLTEQIYSFCFSLDSELGIQRKLVLPSE